jgi:hypothetical protein
MVVSDEQRTLILAVFRGYFHLDKNVSNITIDSEGRLDVVGNVTLLKRDVNKLPLKFGKITGTFTASRGELTTLENSPYHVTGSFNVTVNKLTTLEGGPVHVGDVYEVTGNPLVNLNGLATHIGDAVSFNYSPNLPLLRTLVAKRIWPYPAQTKLEEILDKYAGEGKRGVIRCQKELIAAGFEGNAKW